MPIFIQSIAVIAALACALCLASLALDLIRSWYRERPNPRRKTHGTRITTHNFDSQYPDP
jgi:hypothetical protein